MQPSEHLQVTPLVQSDVGQNTHVEQTPQQVGKATDDTPVLHTSSSLLSTIQSLTTVITRFNGDSSKYQLFKSKFCTIVDSLDLKDIEKAVLLYTSLEDDVIDYLTDIIEDGSLNYQKLWSQLDYEFDPPRHGLFNHAAALFRINSMDICNSLDKLSKLYKFIKHKYIALDKIDAASEVEGFAMMVLSKLRGDLAEKISSYIIQMKGKPVMQEVLNLIREELTTIEIKQIAVGLKEHSSKQEDTYEKEPDGTSVLQSEATSCKPSTWSSQQRMIKKTRCIFCMEDTHCSSMCKRYMNPKEYQRFLFKRRLCFNCFEEGHKGYSCPQLSECHLCDDRRKHSSLLCSNYYY